MAGLLMSPTIAVFYYPRACSYNGDPEGGFGKCQVILDPKERKQRSPSTGKTLLLPEWVIPNQEPPLCSIALLLSFRQRRLPRSSQHEQLGCSIASFDARFPGKSASALMLLADSLNVCTARHL